jgi:hypothetical protein
MRRIAVLFVLVVLAPARRAAAAVAAVHSAILLREDAA